ncbi:hypothetical protein ZWY2020_018858 [Hordeum vulgare]|nr:hypothetical protein ZWY2020_018858 [Hordeum vulgare]
MTRLRAMEMTTFGLLPSSPPDMVTHVPHLGQRQRRQPGSGKLGDLTKVVPPCSSSAEADDVNTGESEIGKNRSGDVNMGRSEEGKVEAADNVELEQLVVGWVEDTSTSDLPSTGTGASAKTRSRAP